MSDRCQLHPGDESDEQNNSAALSSLVLALHDDSGDHSTTVISRHLRAATAIRNLIATDDARQIEHVLQATAVQRLLALLARETHCECFQTECARIASHLATSAHGTRVLVQFGGVPALILLLRSASQRVREPALFAVANMTRSSARARDLVLAYAGAMQSVVDAIVDMSWSELRCGVEPLTNLCCVAPVAQWPRVCGAVPVLVAWLEHFNDGQLLLRVCESLANITSYGSAPQRRALLPAMPRLVQLLTHDSIEVALQVLRCVETVAAAPNDVSVVAVDCGVLPAIVRLLELWPDALDRVAISVVEILHCIADGNEQHVSALIDSGAIAAVGVLATLSFTIARSICDLLFGVAARCNTAQQRKLVRECDFVRILLSVQHANVDGAIQTLHRLLSNNTGFLWTASAGQDELRSDTIEALLQCDGVKALEQMRQSTEGMTQTMVVECLDEVYKQQWNAEDSDSKN